MRLHIHILGICGTFMGGLAQLARESGVVVTGSDEHVYPPMSDALKAAGIEVREGYRAEDVDEIHPDVWVVGNAISRGNPLLEEILDRGLPYVSGPQWLSEHILLGRDVLVVSGTHGKTTTTSLAAWILLQNGVDCGYLIGGVPQWSDKSARLGSRNAPFVIEGDEYDTAFFDKRSKFVHYRPKVAILNNLEFDHADIFEDLAAIEKQFHHMVRIIPRSGLVVANGCCEAIDRVLAKGVWCPVERFDGDGVWRIDDGAVLHDGVEIGRLEFGMSGRYNELNALAAIAAVNALGVPPKDSLAALKSFSGVKRRQEVKGEAAGVVVMDDFAHHPTAVAETIAGVREKMKKSGRSGRIIAVLEPRSNTMKMGVMKARLAESLKAADEVFCYFGPGVKWDPQDVLDLLPEAVACRDLDEIVQAAAAAASSGDVILCMSNGAFGGIHGKLLKALEAKEGAK